MAVVQSFGALQRYGDSPTDPGYWRGGSLDTISCATYAAIYKSQPNVRTVIDFLARNIAQVGLHVYRRVSDTDRKRLRDHELARWLGDPNPETTNYRLLENLVQDVGIYGMAYWLKVRLRDRLGLVRIPPEDLEPLGWLLATGYVWTKPDGSQVSLRPKDVVTFRLFNPDDPLVGLSNLETLRQLLNEEAAASSYRQAFWRNAARLEGVITRPTGVPKWTTEQKESFREQWRARFSGAPGQTAVLEDGMTFTPTTYSARESEFTTARKLTREEVAAEYHVPLPMVGILEHATFSNIREQHKNLYQDCLGPWFEFIQQEIERQLLPECDDDKDVYVEANVQAKLQGSFEEQSLALRAAIGRPWMTPNEGRARLNLPSVKDDETADKIALPLNMAGAEEPEPEPVPSSGQTVPPSPPPPPPAKPVPAKTAALAIRATWDRQEERLLKLRRDERASAFDVARWNRELAGDLERIGMGVVVAATLARVINADTLELLVRHEDAFTPGREAAWYVEETALA